MRGSRGRGGSGSGPPTENHNHIGFLSNTGPDPLNNHKAIKPDSNRAIIGRPAKHHYLARRWRADDDPLKVAFGSSLSSST